MKRTLTHTSRRRMLLALGLLSLGGCWGSFNLTGRVYDWNGSFSSKWASWGVFLVFIIIPVYGTLLFVDAIALNTIEFFSGNNPVSRKKADLGGGQHLVMEREADDTRVRVEHYDHGRVVRTFVVEQLGDDELRIVDGGGRARLHVGGHRGGARLRDEDGRTIADLDRAALDDAIAASEAGMPVAERLLDGLDAPSLHRMLATTERLDRRGWV